MKRIIPFSLLAALLLAGCSGYADLGIGVLWNTCGDDSCETMWVQGVDPGSFVAFNGSYAKDAARAYYRGHPIALADASSFTALTDTYAKDNQHAYYRWRVIQGADGSTFRIGTGFHRDAKHVFLYRSSEHHVVMLDVCDVESFRTLECDWAWALDDECVYSEGGYRLEGADPSSFRVLDCVYARDRDHIYKSQYPRGVTVIGCQECANDARCSEAVKPLPCPEEPD